MKAAIEIEIEKTEVGIKKDDLQALVELSQKFPDRTIRVILKEPERSFKPYVSYKEFRKQMCTLDEPIFYSRINAEEVLDDLADVISEYGYATVADFKDLSGMECHYVDNHFGWVSLKKAQVARVRDGYIINMPPALPIDK